ncbi:hypothetical protein IFR05_009256 [Cadophora sp. M221]|nr:hypothetical protein IFR05_009256 [Cadophora sp. M221]
MKLSWSKNGAEYEAINASETKRTKSWPRIHLLLSFLTTILAISITAVTTWHIARRENVSPNPSAALVCGRTVEEALSHGCQFDSLSKAWLPATCSRYGMDEFVNRSDGSSGWKYWADREGRVPIEDISQLAATGVQETWWTTEREHLTHCAYLAIRLSHSVQMSAPVDNLGHNFEHAKHCSLYLLQRALEADTVDLINTSGNSLYGTCW